MIHLLVFGCLKVVLNVLTFYCEFCEFFNATWCVRVSIIQHGSE